MKKIIFKFNSFLAFVIGLACLFSCSVKKEENQVCFKEKCFRIEIVDTPEKRKRGLQFREFLPADQGMLFIFPVAAIHSFWMKDTFIPLDMIWIDYYGRVVHLEENVEPCSADPCPVYTPSQEASYVLELNAGIASELGLKKSDKLIFYFQEKGSEE